MQNCETDVSNRLFWSDEFYGRLKWSPIDVDLCKVCLQKSILCPIDFWSRYSVF